MKTITLDILDDKAIELLNDLEAKGLIKIQDVIEYPFNSFAKYEGQMTKQSVEEIDRQLQELRDEWNRDF